MTLETVYWIALAVGALFLLGSIVLGDIFDFLDFLDIDLGGGFSATPVLFTTLAGFGAGGLLGLKAFDLSEGASVWPGLGTAVVMGGLAVFLFMALGKQEGKTFGTGELVGERGRCVLAIPANREGRVAIHYAGMTRTYTASSTDPVAVGEEVVVVDAIGNALKVQAIAVGQAGSREA